MNRRTLFFTMLFPLLCLSGPATANEPVNAPVSGPVAVTPETVHSFGSVLEGEDVLHDFVVRNTGTEELHIQKVEAG